MCCLGSSPKTSPSRSRQPPQTKICSCCYQFLKETVYLCCLGSSPQISPSRSRHPPLPKSVHYVNNFFRKLSTFVAWAPLPRFPLPDPGRHPSQNLFMLLPISEGNCLLVLPGLLSPDFPFQIQASTPPQICSLC